MLADAYYNGIGTTRITLFETNGNNSYEAVARIDLVGVFSFYAGTMQVVDIDNDGIDEVAVCIDGNFLILKFNGRQGFQSYEVFYIKQNELATEGSAYYGGIMYDLLNDGNQEILISMDHDPQQQNYFRYLTRIYKFNKTTSVVEENKIYPTLAELFQNYPNPFNSETYIKFYLGKPNNVLIKVYNVLGKEIKQLLNENLLAGGYTIQWDGKDDNGSLLSGGVYLIIMSTDNYQKTIKTILLK